MSSISDFIPQRTDGEIGTRDLGLRDRLSLGKSPDAWNRWDDDLILDWSRSAVVWRTLDSGSEILGGFQMTPTELEGMWFGRNHFPVRMEANLAAAQHELEEAGHGFLPQARRRELDDRRHVACWWPSP